MPFSSPDLLLRTAVDAVLAVDGEGTIVKANALAEELFGAGSGELADRSVDDLLPGLVVPAEPVGDEGHTRQPPRVSLVDAQLLDQGTCPVEVTVHALTDSLGDLSVVSVRDRRTQQGADTTFRAVIEAAPDAILLVAEDGRIRFANASAERLFGYDRIELVGATIDLLVTEELRTRHAAHREAYLQEPLSRPMGAHLDLTGRHRDGTAIPVEISLSPLNTGDSRLTIAAVRDVSVHRRAEALGARARREAAVAEIGHLALTTGDLDEVLRRATWRAAALLGSDVAVVADVVAPGRLVVRVASDEAMLPPGQRFDVGGTVAGEAIERFETVVVEDVATDPRTMEIPGVLEIGARSGMFVPMYVGARLLGGLAVLSRRSRTYNEDDIRFGRALANLLAAAVDRAAAARRLADSRTRLQTVIDHTPAAIYVKDLDGRFELVNKFLADGFGRDPRSIIGLTDFDLFPREQAEVLRANDAEALASSEPLEVQEEAKVQGSDRTFITLKFPLRDPAGRPYALAGVSTDVTDRIVNQREQEALAARLRQSERLETVGQLAGGIAHDFNNLLAVIMNFAGFVRDEVPEGSTAAQDVEQIREAARRASELTRRLLVFSRRQSVEVELVDVGEVLEDVRHMLSRTLGGHISLAVDIEPGLPVVEADRSQLDQVVMNLAVNARDAMPDGGTLTLAVSRARLDASFAGADGSSEFVSLSVSDTGTGMDEATRERAFEPFFTTKGSGMGTGLGLATVYGIATQAGGHVDLESAPGRGTTVRVLLPSAGEAPAEAPPRADAGPRRRGNGERLLVVEDEPAVRRSTVRILREAGYSVTEASTGEEALALAGNGRHVDLLLTDMVMPGMGGQELAERLLARREVPVVFVSGYTEDQLGEDAPLPEAAFIAKPFSAERLLEVIGQQLSRSS